MRRSDSVTLISNSPDNLGYAGATVQKQRQTVTASSPDTRALARLTGEAARLEDTIKAMQRLAGVLSLTIRIEVNNLMEVNDLLRHKLHAETLSRVIHHPPDLEDTTTMESEDGEDQ